MSDTPITESLQFRRGAMGPTSKHSELVVHASEMAKMEKERDQWKAYARHLPECDVNDPDPGIPTVIKKCNCGFDKLNTP